MPHESIRILHVEDDLTDALIAREGLMGEAGINQFDVVHVDRLKLALEELSQHGYGAVLLDLGLRDVSGLDNIRAINAQNPDVPIVVLSGLDNDKIARDAIDCGAEQYLVKGHCDGKTMRLVLQSSAHRAKKLHHVQ